MITVLQQKIPTDAGRLVLTTDSPASSYGIPVLRHEGCGCPDLGPSDPTPLCMYPERLVQLFGPRDTAAELVAYLARLRGDEETKAAAQAFCAQWPEGPQVMLHGHEF